jgi:hypothetical protein
MMDPLKKFRIYSTTGVLIAYTNRIYGHFSFRKLFHICKVLHVARSRTCFVKQLRHDVLPPLHSLPAAVLSSDCLSGNLAAFDSPAVTFIWEKSFKQYDCRVCLFDKGHHHHRRRHACLKNLSLMHRPPPPPPLCCCCCWRCQRTIKARSKSRRRFRNLNLRARKVVQRKTRTE